MAVLKRWCFLVAIAAVLAGAPIQGKAFASANTAGPTIEDPDPFPFPLPPPLPDPDRPGPGEVRV